MKKEFEAFLTSEVGRLDQEGLRRGLRNLKGFQGKKINLDGREVYNFCSNNYLGLADDARLSQAALDCIKEEGFGSGASRLVCGNMPAHQALERAMAAFKGTDKCLLFSSGYMANIGIISALFDENDIIFSDKLNHASIVDGILLSGAQFKRYRHNNMEMLEDLLKRNTEAKKKCIITDSIFSMDGDMAPLDQIVSLAKVYGCSVMVDEAHAFGILGETGKGVVEHFGVEDEVDIQMGTLSKAAGSYGAYCCGSTQLIDFLINKARSFIYTTGLPPSVAAASLKAIEIIKDGKLLRKNLWENARYMRAQLKLMGFDTILSQTPVIPILVKESKLAVEFSDQLFHQGVFVSAIRPPTVPVHTARLRLTVMATHTKMELDYALRQIKEIGQKLCII